MTGSHTPSSDPGTGAAATRQLDLEIVRMAWPAIASLLLVNAIELVDIAMVGRLGRESVAAVGYAAQFMHLVVTLLQAIAIAGVALMARAIGAGALERARAALTAVLAVSLGLGGLATVLVWVAPAWPLQALGAEPGVVALSTPYFRLIISSSLVLAFTASLESGYRARRNTRVPLVAVAVTALVKIALNGLLVFGLLGFPRLELVGAGIATLLAHLSALLVYLVASRVEQRQSADRLRLSLTALRSNFRVVSEMLRVALPAVGERLVMNLGLLAYFAILSHSYGAAAIAAYAIGVRLLAFSWIPGLGFSVAAATLVGQALGADNVALAKRSGWRAMRLGLMVMAALGVACAFLRTPLAQGFTSDAAIIEDLVPFLLVLAIAQPFMGVHFTLSGALRGAGDTVTPLFGATVGNWLVRVPLAWLFATSGASVVWVWSALVGDHIVRSIWSTLAFRGGRWARPRGISRGGLPAPAGPSVGR